FINMLRVFQGELSGVVDLAITTLTRSGPPALIKCAKDILRYQGLRLFHGRQRILERWRSTHSNARMEAMNGLFQAARARARGYRNTETFITMIYLIAAPLGDIFKST
ncbi:transposase, partial [Magnetovibrio blakemorei]